MAMMPWVGGIPTPMPEPYLIYPDYSMTADEEQEAAQYSSYLVAKEVYDLCDEMAAMFDQKPDYWAAEHYDHLCETRQQLRNLRAENQIRYRLGIKGKPPCSAAPSTCPSNSLDGTDKSTM